MNYFATPCENPDANMESESSEQDGEPPYEPRLHIAEIVVVGGRLGVRGYFRLFFAHEYNISIGRVLRGVRHVGLSMRL